MRVISELRSLGEAKKLEETIKTGYVDPIIESIVDWIAVEEDLAESYEKLSKSLASGEERETANAMHVLSRSDVDLLRRKLAEFEGLDSEYRKRIRLVRKLAGGATPK